MSEKIKKSKLSENGSYENPQPWVSDNGEFGNLVTELSEHFKNEDKKPIFKDLGAKAATKEEFISSENNGKETIIPEKQEKTGLKIENPAKNSEKAINNKKEKILETDSSRAIDEQKEEFIDKELEASKDFILMQMKTFSSDEEREEFIEGLKLAAEERWIEKIKTELELDQKAYAEMGYKKRKAWDAMKNFLEKEDIQKRFDNDSEVLLMKKAYHDKLAEYKNALILDIKENNLTKEELNNKLGEVINELLDESNKFLNVCINVRKENNEKAFTDKSQETFISHTNYHKIFPPIKENNANGLKTKDSTPFHADNLTIKEVDNLIRNKLDKLESGVNHDVAVELIRSDAVKEYANSHGIASDEAMEKLSKANNETKFSMAHDSTGWHAHFNEKIVTKDDIKQEDVIVRQDSGNHVKSEWQEIMEMMEKINIADSLGMQIAAVKIKSSIFGKSNEIFSTVINKNLAEIMNSEKDKEAFLEKIPKDGKTFFNKLIKQIPPKPEDTFKKWIVRVIHETKNQKK